MPDENQQIVQLERQLAHLNAYLTVSSVLTQSLGLHDLLETILYCSMDAVSAEAASVLLLDDDKKNFQFYQTEGPAKPILMMMITGLISIDAVTLGKMR